MKTQSKSEKYRASRDDGSSKSLCYLGEKACIQYNKNFNFLMLKTKLIFKIFIRIIQDSVIDILKFGWILSF